MRGKSPLSKQILYIEKFKFKTLLFLKIICMFKPYSWKHSFWLRTPLHQSENDLSDSHRNRMSALCCCYQSLPQFFEKFCAKLCCLEQLRHLNIFWQWLLERVMRLFNHGIHHFISLGNICFFVNIAIAWPWHTNKLS